MRGSSRISPELERSIHPEHGPGTDHEDTPQRFGHATRSSALILSHNPESRDRLRNEARLAGSIAVIPDPAMAELNWCVQKAEGFDYCVIDVDFAGDEESTLDLCLRMKNSAGHLSVILLGDQSILAQDIADGMSLCDGRLSTHSTSDEFVQVVQTAIVRGAMRGAMRNPTVAQRTAIAANHELIDGGGVAGWWIIPAAVVGASLWIGLLSAAWALF